MRWTLGAWCLMLACDPAVEGTDANTVTDTQVTDSGTIYIPPIDDVDRSASLSGVVRDGAGDPIEAALIRFCRKELCKTGETDAAGAYGFINVEVDWHSFEVRPPLGDDVGAVGYIALEFESDEARTVDIVLPDLDTATALPATNAAEIEAGAGLWVTVAASDLAPPSVFDDPATEVAGVHLDEAWYPPLDIGVTGAVVGMWYLGPFDHAAGAGLPVRFANTFGAKDSTVFDVWQGSYKDQRWVPAGSVTANGGWLEGTARLGLLTTTVLVEAEARK